MVENLEHKIQLLNVALTAAGVGTWSLDPTTGKVEWDERCRELHGFSKNESITYDAGLRFVHHDDVDRVKQAVAIACNSNGDGRYDVHFRTVGADDKLVRYLHCKGQAYFNDKGAIVQFAGIAMDETSTSKLVKELATAHTQRRQALNMLGAADFVIDMVADICNLSTKAAILLTGEPTSEIKRSEFIKVIHPEDELLRQAALSDLISNGATELNVRVIWKDGSIRHITQQLHAVKDERGRLTEVWGIVAPAENVRVQAPKVTNVGGNVNAIFAQAPLAIAVLRGPDFIIETANARILPLMRRNSDIIGKPLLDVFPELEGQQALALLRNVYATGEAAHVQELPGDVMTADGLVRGYYSFSYAPLIQEGQSLGIIVTAIDVTEQVMNRKTIEESEAKFRALIEEAPIATCFFAGRELKIEVANDIMLGYWGKDRSVIGKPLAEAVPELVGQPFLDILDNVYTTGETYTNKAAYALLEVNGVLGGYYFDFAYKPLKNAAGEVYGIMDMAIDVTEQVKAQQKLMEAQMELRGAIEVAGLVTWTMNIRQDTFNYSPRFMEWLGFTNDTENFERAFEPLPDEYRKSVPEALARAIASKEGIYDIEHPIVNTVTGQMRIIHAQGQVFYDANGAADTLKGVAQDITEQRNIQLRLSQEVELRTNELAAAIEQLEATNEELQEANDLLVHSNEELAQYAYVASHDLQEPLRKIRVFSDMLSRKDDLSDSNRQVVDKINLSAERMTLLIKDLLDFSRLLKTDKLAQKVKLGDIMRAVAVDFELAMTEKNATIQIGELPEVEAVPLQMNQLFYNLVGNALKFTDAARAPWIKVSAVKMEAPEVKEFIRQPQQGTDYYKISFADNGIGFEQQYAEHIFEVFKRLHARGVYPGSGIGLALCRRIVTNHSGHMYASAKPGAGATFYVILPARQPAAGDE
jgi:signal transduction histidine kinase